MKHLLVACLLAGSLQSSLSQETPPNMKIPVQVVLEPKVQAFVLPKDITPPHLATILMATRSGYYEPMQVMQAIIARGSWMVPLLEETLMSDSLTDVTALNGQPGDSLSFRAVTWERRGLGYVVPCLEGIGTQECYEILLQQARVHRDPRVRAAALTALGHSYHSRVFAGDLKPDPEVVHVLLQCADDATPVDSRQMRIGDIAREGLLVWLGLDAGECPESGQTVLVGAERNRMNIAQYREYWWNRVSGGLAWSKSNGRFDLPK